MLKIMSVTAGCGRCGVSAQTGARIAMVVSIIFRARNGSFPRRTNLIRPRCAADSAKIRREKWNPTDHADLRECEAGLFLQITGQPEQTEIPNRIADETKSKIPQRLRVRQSCGQVNFMSCAGVLSARLEQIVCGWIAVNQPPHYSHRQSQYCGDNKCRVPAEFELIAMQPAAAR